MNALLTSALETGLKDAAHARPLVKPWVEQERSAALAAFEQGGEVEVLLATLSAIIDALVHALADASGVKENIAIIATGGYGRGELFPHSDIDLLLLYRGGAEKEAKPLAELLLTTLWDLGLKVGQAMRTVEETLTLAAEDTTVRTNLLDARLVAGDAPLFKALCTGLQQSESPLAFVEAKLAERDLRHKRYGDSRYLLEPNIKEGKGGLRDLHTLYWLARYVYGVKSVAELVPMGLLTEEEYRIYADAEHFLRHLRAHLHVIAGKAEERLTFDLQQKLAGRLGYRGRAGSKPVERMMKRYFLTASAVGSLTRIVCALLEEEKKRKPTVPPERLQALTPLLQGFTLDGERLQVEDAEEFTRAPIRMLALFHVAQETELDIHPKALQAVTRNLRRIDHAFLQNAEANALFMEILLSPKGPETALRRMNEAGLLGRFLPDFRRIVGQMQFNMYHVYTVDEHTIVALGTLHRIEQGALIQELPLASEVIHRVQSRRVLYLSLMCHDIAKGRGGDHSEIGANIVRKLAARFGFTEEEQDSCAWLVRNHLLLSETAFKRDAADPHTVRDFMAGVESAERLRLLLCLTVADIRAVAPDTWNAWKGALLRELFLRAEEAIATGRPQEWTEEARAALEQELLAFFPSTGAGAVRHYLNICPPALLGGLSPERHAKLCLLLETFQEKNKPLALDIVQEPARGVTHLTLVAEDRQGLFSRIAGVMSLCGASIQGAQIFTLKSGMAVDIFHIQDENGKAYNKPDKLSRLNTKLSLALTGKLDIDKELAVSAPRYPTRKDAFQVPARVFINNDASQLYTVIEIIGRDRIGFLYAVTHALAALGVSIVTAHISTYGEQAVDVFYVKDAFGAKLTQERKVETIQTRLLECLEA